MDHCRFWQGGNQAKRLQRTSRSILFAVLRLSGIPLLVRELIQRRRVTIVVYHAMPVWVAERHLRALKARYHIISLADYLAWRKQGARRALPPRSLIITLDDGHKNNFELKPLLEQQQVPVTVFLCSGVVGTHRHYWWFHANHTAEVHALKEMPNDARLQKLKELGFEETKQFAERQALSRIEIDQMRKIADFQAHTVFHPILPACAEERARWEIVQCKRDLEQDSRIAVRALAYPNGNYTEREVNLAKEAGFECALSLDPGFNDAATDLFRLKRIPLPDDASVSELLVKTSGLWELIRALRVKSSQVLRAVWLFNHRRGNGKKNGDAASPSLCAKT